METTCQRLIGLFVLCIIAITASEVSYSSETDRLVAKNLKLLEERMARLEAAEKRENRNSRVQQQDVEFHQEILIAIARKSDEQGIATAFEKAMKSKDSNKRQAFINALVDENCRTREENCRLKRQIAEIEKEYEQFQQQRLEFERQQLLQRQSFYKEREEFLAEREAFQKRVDAIATGSLPYGGYYRGQNPSVPDLAPTDPGPVREQYHRPPTSDPSRMTWRWRNYTIVKVFGSRGQICPHAKLVGKCVDLPLPDGSYYHGNVYQDCSGRVALVTHRKRNS